MKTNANYLSPADTNRLLEECFWLEFECSRMTMGWAPAIPDWDEKGRLIYMAYLHTQHANHLRDRINELPGSRISDRSWTPDFVKEGCERISTAPSAAEFAAGYGFLLEKLFGKYDHLKRLMDPILDAPTFERLKWIETDREELRSWALSHTHPAASGDPEAVDRCRQWTAYAEEVWSIMDGEWARAGAEEGARAGAATEGAAATPSQGEVTAPSQREVTAATEGAVAAASGGAAQAPSWPAHPAEHAAGPVPAEAAVDPRFPHFRGEYPSAIYDPSSPLYDSVRQMVYINATEMTSAETMAYLYYGVQKMPFDFYLDIARHTWDEVRHSQMGVRRLRQWGYRTEDFGWQPVHVPDPSSMKTAFPEFYAGLTMIAEPCSFTKKRKSAEAFRTFGDELSAVQSEFDLADERIHVELGKKWGAKLFEHMDDFETAKAVEEKVRRRRLERMEIPDKEIEGLLKNFPQLCGFTTTTLNYGKY